jgi:hypothetical protein
MRVGISLTSNHPDVKDAQRAAASAFPISLPKPDRDEAGRDRANPHSRARCRSPAGSPASRRHARAPREPPVTRAAPNRRSRSIARSALANSNAPASDVTTRPSNATSTQRPSTGSNPNKSRDTLCQHRGAPWARDKSLQHNNFLRARAPMHLLREKSGLARRRTEFGNPVRAARVRALLRRSFGPGSREASRPV